MQRVAVIGSAGSGKSVFSRRLAQITRLPLHHLDALHWGPGWEPMPREHWRALQMRLVEGERWIIDGNYRGTMELRLAAADSVVLLDLPRRVCLWRVLMRWARFRHGGRADMADGQRERLDLDFLLWIWRYPKVDRPAVLERLAALPPTTQVHRLRTSRAIDAFLRHVAATLAA